ncbi:MAG: PorV/PorQ family protein [Candidatus Eisenbacteria bacterium]|nr:PorV/PorQ family protein [Candidatus Eisenbacteria bacterium]
MRGYVLILGAFVLLLAAAGPAAAGTPGTGLAAFLEVDGGVRQIGMGGAFTGVSDDAMCVFYNPAGLRFLEGSEVHMSASDWIADISYQHLSYGFTHSSIPGYFGISWTIMQMPPFREKTEYYDPDSEFDVGTLENVDAGDMAWGGSYAWAFTDYLSVGATIRWYHLNMADAFAEGVCGDVGVLYDTPFRNLRLGASVNNVGPSNRWSGVGSETGFGESYSMPTTYRAGASVRVFDVVTHRVVLAGEFKRTSFGANRASLGTEYTFNRGPLFVYGRAGYRLGYDEEGLTLGGGVQFPSSKESDIRIDYAYVDMGTLDYIQRVSVALFF